MLQNISSILPVGVTSAQIRARDEVCSKHGAYVAKLGLRDLWTRCPQCVAEEQKAETKQLLAVMQAENQAKQKIMAVEKAIVDAGIPKRFRDKRINHYVANTAEQKNAKSFAVEFVKEFETEHSGRNVVFHGNRGNGKNHLACAIANAVIERFGKTAHFTTANDMLRRIREAKSFDSNVTESQVIDALVSFDLLVVDEVRILNRNSEADARAFFDVFNARYAEMRPTIFICNGDLIEFEKSVGDLTMSRMKETGGRPWNVLFSWEDYRK